MKSLWTPILILCCWVVGLARATSNAKVSAVGTAEVVPLDMNDDPTAHVSATLDCQFLAGPLTLACTSAINTAFRIHSLYQPSQEVRTASSGLVSKRLLADDSLQVLLITTERAVTKTLPSKASLESITISRGAAGNFGSGTTCSVVSGTEPMPDTSVTGVRVAVVQCNVPKRDTELHTAVLQSQPLLPAISKQYASYVGVAFGGSEPAVARDDVFAPEGSATLHSGIFYTFEASTASHTSPAKFGFEGHLLVTAPSRFSCVHIGGTTYGSRISERNACLHFGNPGLLCPYFKWVYPHLSWKEQAKLRDFVDSTRDVSQRHCPGAQVSLSIPQRIYAFLTGVVIQEEL